MPYEIRSEGGKHCVAKQGESGTMKCYDDKAKAVAYLRALYANVHESVENVSMNIVKARLQDGKMVIKMTSSDTGKDFYDEAMSRELFDDFISRVDSGIPDVFKSVILRGESWTGGMPYISIAHYKSGKDNINVPGEVTWIGRDGDVLKATGVLYDTPLGRAVFKSLQKDLTDKREDKSRISIGFLDLEHSHGEKFTFTRNSLTDKCPLCKEGVGDKIYKKGCLVHLALTRVPANPRTDVEVERSMTTKREDAESIIEDEEVIKGLDLKSTADDVLVIKAVPDGCPCKEGDQECIDKWKNDQESDSEDASEMTEESLVEEAARKDVTPADKKAAEKEYGDVSYADEANKKYPIDTEEHIRAAWNYIHQERNAAKYSDNGASVKKHILSAWKKVIGGEPPSVEKSVAENTVVSPIEKSLAALVERVAAIKSQGLSGEDALKAIQPDFEQVGEVLKAEFTPAPSPEEVAQKSMETTLRSLLNEILPSVVAPMQAKLESLESELRAKSLATTPTKKEEIATVQRSLPASVAQKQAIEQLAQKTVSQFDRIARQSVGLQ